MDRKLLSNPVVVLKKLPHPYVVIAKEDERGDNETKVLTSRMSRSVNDDNYLNNDPRTKSKKHRKPARQFQCTLCTKTFQKPSNLKHHLLRHTSEKPRKCGSCEKRFASRNQLVIHERTHTNERPHKCTECDMAFRQMSHLKQHSRKHTSRRLSVGVGYERTHESKLYACTVCGKSFTTNRWLKAHTRIFHTGETPYKCKQCCKEFPSHQKYYYHMKSSHEECKHKCPDCGKSFAISWNLNSHKLLHLNSKHYVCSDCNARFLYAKDLKIHLLRHAAGLQTCLVCGQILLNPLRLKFHIQSHLFSKLFACGECGKEFAERSCAVKHFDFNHSSNSDKRNNLDS